MIAAAVCLWGKCCYRDEWSASFSEKKLIEHLMRSRAQDMQSLCFNGQSLCFMICLKCSFKAIEQIRFHMHSRIVFVIVIVQLDKRSRNTAWLLSGINGMCPWVTAQLSAVDCEEISHFDPQNCKQDYLDGLTFWKMLVSADVKLDAARLRSKVAGKLYHVLRSLRNA